MAAHADHGRQRMRVRVLPAGGQLQVPGHLPEGQVSHSQLCAEKCSKNTKIGLFDFCFSQLFSNESFFPVTLKVFVWVFVLSFSRAFGKLTC